MELSRQEKKNLYWTFLFFMIWPFAIFVKAIVKYDVVYLRVFYVLFYALIGYSFVYVGDAPDWVRDMTNFKNYSTLSFGEFGDLIKNILTFNSQQTDIYLPVSSYLMSFITSNGKVMFAVWSGIYGFFSLKCLLILLGEVQSKKTQYAFLFLFIFFAFVPFSGASTVRFSTAMFVFTYGLLSVILKKKNKYIFVCLLSALVHFSLIIPSALLIFSLIIGRKIWISYIIFIVSFVASGSLNSKLMGNTEKLPDVYNTKAKSYSDIEYIDNLKDLRTDLIGIFRVDEIAINWYIYVCFFGTQILLYRKNLLWDNRLFYYTSFLLLIWSIVNLSSNNYDAQFRMWLIFKYAFFGYILLIYILNHNDRLVIRLAQLSLFPSVVHFILMVRQSTEFLDWRLFFGNIFSIIFSDATDLSIVTVIKNIF